MYAAMCLLDKPMPSNRDWKHKQCAYFVGDAPNRMVRTRIIEDQTPHGIDWDPMGFELHDSADTKNVLANLVNLVPDGQFDPFALAAKAKSPDTFTYKEAMNGPHEPGMKQAAHIEKDTLEDKDTWKKVKREPWMHVLKSTWVFRIKRFSDGTVRKFKARFCARGDLQVHNVDYFDTWAPVVSWTTVRLLLVLSTLMGLATRQGDYTAAFVHADIDKPPNWDSMLDF